MSIYGFALALRKVKQEVREPEHLIEVGDSQENLLSCDEPLQQENITLVDIDELINDIDFATRVLGPDTHVPDDVWKQLCQSYPNHFRQLTDSEDKLLAPLPAREVRSRLLAIKSLNNEKS